MNLPTPEEKQRMIDLIKELRGILLQLPTLTRQPGDQKEKTVSRLQEIRQEMIAYKMRYPNG